jgi:hypothetical protein
VLCSTTLLVGCPEGGVELPDTKLDNSDPVANAGADQTILNLTRADLDGSASSDADGDALDYSWSFTSVPAGSTTQLMDATTTNPYFTADVVGDYVISLSVDEIFGGADSDTVTITAEQPPTNPPVANAGGPYPDVVFSMQGTTVQLDGSGSSDPDGDPLTYTWTVSLDNPLSGVPPQTPVVLINPDTAMPSFDVIAIDQLGEYTITLTVSDGTLSDTDTTTVDVVKAAPTAQVLLGSGLLIGAFVGLRQRRRARRPRRTRR